MNKEVMSYEYEGDVFYHFHLALDANEEFFTIGDLNRGLNIFDVNSGKKVLRYSNASQVSLPGAVFMLSSWDGFPTPMATETKNFGVAVGQLDGVMIYDLQPT